jgi:hypothetical protein
MISELLSQASVDFGLVAVMFSRSTTRQCTNIVLAIIQSILDPSARSDASRLGAVDHRVNSTCPLLDIDPSHYLIVSRNDEEAFTFL